MSRNDHPRNLKAHDIIVEVTERIGGRSAAARGEYLERTRKRKLIEPARGKLACANLAHVMAASGEDKSKLQQSVIPNIGIVTSYNDMLSAHRPFEPYPEVIRAAARRCRRHGAGRGRRACDVRRRHAGPRGHGALAVQPRRDRAGDRGSPVATRRSTPPCC